MSNNELEILWLARVTVIRYDKLIVRYVDDDVENAWIKPCRDVRQAVAILDHEAAHYEKHHGGERETVVTIIREERAWHSGLVKRM